MEFLGRTTIFIRPVPPPVKRQTITLERPGPYTVVTAAEPVDESIELALPSDVPKGP